jgi:subtilisin family serine protease
MSNFSRIPLFILLICSFYPVLTGQSTVDPRSKMADDLLDRFRTNGEAACMIYLNDQMRHIPGIPGSKTDKASFMYETLSANASRTQKRLREFLEDHNIPYRSFFIVNALAARMDRETAERIASFPEVAFVSFDAPVSRESVREETNSSPRDGTPEWGLQVIQADKVWDLGIDGTGAVVGGMDTGYDWTHPALKTRYRGYLDENTADHNYNWHDAIHEISPLHNDSIVDPSNNPCGLDVDFPCDDGSHGTHTMGTMVGLDGGNIIGVAPGAQWIGVRNMERGWGKPSTYIEGFEWFLAPTDLNGENPDPSKSPHVINNSWSCPTIEGCDSTNWAFMDTAIENLRKAGTVVVVSASNNGNSCGRINAPPAIFEGTFAVAATQITDTVDGVFIDDIAGYSSWGPVLVDGSLRLKPDIAAPGSRVRSSKPGNNYGTSSGTSMAGPHVAGVVALMIDANPGLAGQVDAIEEIIQLTADPKFRTEKCSVYSGDSIPNFIFGYGRINALEAVKTALISTKTEKPETDHSGFRLFPNPADEYVRLDWDAEQSSVNVKLIDQHGHLILFQPVEKSGKIRVESLPAGIYYLRTVIANRLITKKMVIR